MIERWSTKPVSFCMENIKKRFHAKYTKHDNGCWIWHAGKHHRGYGYFYTHPDYSNRKMDYAHRVSYHIDSGVKPKDDDLICHSCDTPSCVNPSHLFIGSFQDNMDDMISKKRFICGVEKINKQDELDIIKLRAEGVMVKDIAKMYNISKSHMSRISRGLRIHFNKDVSS